MSESPEAELNLNEPQTVCRLHDSVLQSCDTTSAMEQSFHYCFSVQVEHHHLNILIWKFGFYLIKTYCFVSRPWNTSTDRSHFEMWIENTNGIPLKKREKKRKNEELLSPNFHVVQVLNKCLF